MKIAIGEFHQESDSFNPVPTRLERFEQVGIHQGNEMYRFFKGEQYAVSGMIDESLKVGIMPIMLYSMNAYSGGIIEHNVLEGFIENTITQLKNIMPIDGLFLSLHGATQTDEQEDACGYLIEKLRKFVGKDVVISVSLDMHANITKKMMAYADFLCAYHTYPHVDYYETGARAARLGLEMLLHRDQTWITRATVPMIAPASSYTTLHGKYKELMDYAQSLVENQIIIDFSIYQMQPWLDVSEASSGVITVSSSKEAGEKIAKELALKLYSLRHDFKSDLQPIESVIRKAEKNQTGKPIVLVDSSDSTNAGAAGDSPEVIRVIKEMKSKVSAGIYLNDVQAVQESWVHEIGDEFNLNLGGKVPNPFYKSLDLLVSLRSKHDGFFVCEGPARKGSIQNIGRTVVLQSGNITIVLCESISNPGDPQIYRHFGVEPLFYQMVSVKACTSYRVAYEPIAAEICETDTPGFAPVNLFRLNFTKIPRDFFPFTDLSDNEVPCSLTCRERTRRS